MKKSTRITEEMKVEMMLEQMTAEELVDEYMFATIESHDRSETNRIDKRIEAGSYGRLVKAEILRRMSH